MKRYRINEWIGWNGGPCPIHPKDMIKVRIEKPKPYQPIDQVGEAGSFRWEADDSGNSVISFMITKKHEGAREWAARINDQGDILGIVLWNEDEHGAKARLRSPGMPRYTKLREVDE